MAEQSHFTRDVTAGWPTEYRRKPLICLTMPQQLESEWVVTKRTKEAEKERKRKKENAK